MIALNYGIPLPAANGLIYVMHATAKATQVKLDNIHIQYTSLYFIFSPLMLKAASSTNNAVAEVIKQSAMIHPNYW